MTQFGFGEDVVFHSTQWTDAGTGGATTGTASDTTDVSLGLGVAFGNAFSTPVNQHRYSMGVDIAEGAEDFSVVVPVRKRLVRSRLSPVEVWRA